MSLPLQKFTKIEVQNSNLNQVINCTTSCINVAVGGNDFFKNRSLVPCCTSSIKDTTLISRFKLLIGIEHLTRGSGFDSQADQTNNY